MAGGRRVEHDKRVLPAGTSRAKARNTEISSVQGGRGSSSKPARRPPNCSSHSVGLNRLHFLDNFRTLGLACCKGAVAMCADALLIEAPPNTAEALSDGTQQLDLDAFARLMQEIKPHASRRTDAGVTSGAFRARIDTGPIQDQN